MFYFVVWSALGYAADAAGRREQDRTGDPALIDKMSKLSGGRPGGLRPDRDLRDGRLDDVGQPALVLDDLGHALRRRPGPVGAGVRHHRAGDAGADARRSTACSTPHHFHDLGKLLFAFLMLWAYLSFSQFLIIWSANLPEEIPHYLDRWENSWQYLSVVHRRRALHRCPTRCCCRATSSATWASCASSRPGSWSTRVVDYYWHVAPEFHNDGFSFSLLDIALPLALGGIFMSLFVSQLRRPSLLPVNDPDLDKALHHHVH